MYGLEDSLGIYISQLIRFARVCSNVDDFNNINLFLTAKLLKQGYRYHKIRNAFSKFFHRHSELIVKYNIVGVCNCSMFCCTLFYVHSSIAIILMGKKELVA